MLKQISISCICDISKKSAVRTSLNFSNSAFSIYSSNVNCLNMMSSYRIRTVLDNRNAKGYNNLNDFK